MQIEVLGSGGAFTTPQPGCQCRVCRQARAHGVPDNRTGPSYFVHGPDLLIDTPEETKFQLDRAGLGYVSACIYSHWHPDHTAGRRVFEMNRQVWKWPPVGHPTDVYLPQQVAVDARTRLGLWEQLSFMQAGLMVRLVELQDGETIILNGTTIRPFRLHEDYVYAFLLEGDGKRVLIAPDELNEWQVPDDVKGVDLAVIPMGIPEFHPFTGERVVPAEHPVMVTEASYLETLEMARQLQAGRIVLSHIEEPFRLLHSEYEELAARLQAEGLPVTFAYDTMRIDV